MTFSPERASIIAENFTFNNIFDNAAAREDLGFEYTVSWVEGVRRVVTWLEANGKLTPGGDDSFDDRVIATWERLKDQIVDEYLTALS